MSRKKVVLSINASWNIVNFRAGLIRALQREGYEVAALAPPDRFSARLSELGVEHHPIEMDKKGVSPLRDLHCCSALLARARANSAGRLSRLHRQAEHLRIARRPGARDQGDQQCLGARHRLHPPDLADLDGQGAVPAGLPPFENRSSSRMTRISASSFAIGSSSRTKPGCCPDRESTLSGSRREFRRRAARSPSC